MNLIKCHANISNVNGNPGYTSITELVHNNNNQSYLFKCIFNVDSTRPGITEIGLQFADARVPFIYSLNSLYLTFVGKFIHFY